MNRLIGFVKSAVDMLWKLLGLLDSILASWGLLGWILASRELLGWMWNLNKLIGFVKSAVGVEIEQTDRVCKVCCGSAN